MNVRFLETFLWVAKLRSFSAAATRLHATQAAVSNRIATLERDLDTRLFDRDGRDVRLTPSGRLLLERAAAIVRLTGECRASLGGAPAGRRAVALGTADTIVCAWLPRFMERMRADYPGLDLTLGVETSLELLRQVSRGEVDLVFVVGPVHDAELVTLDLGSFACRWVAAPGAAGDPATLHELVAHPLVTYSKGSPPHHALLQLLHGHGIERGAARLCHSNSVTTITRLVRDGLGAACLPDVVTREFVERGEMRRLPIAAVVPPIRFQAVYPDDEGNQVAALVADLASTVAAAFADEADAADPLVLPHVGARDGRVARTDTSLSA